MKPVRTADTNLVYTLPGGSDENDLPCRRIAAGLVESEWALSDEERAAIAAGANVYLDVWGEPHPPVAIGVVRREWRGDHDVVEYV